MTNLPVRLEPTTIRLPNRWVPRPYQMPLWGAL